MTTSSKQDFLSIAAAGSALAPIKFGLGGVPFGNEFEVVSDEAADKTLEAAWNAGVRYYDVAFFVVNGLFYELRCTGVLSAFPKNDDRDRALDAGVAPPISDKE
jgi:aryl-alcohol dehydrogenase-like predicted oxidoreductase